MEQNESMAERNESAEVHSRMDRLENLLEGIASTVGNLAPVAALVPGGATAAAVVTAVASAGDAIIDAIEGDIDPAAMAAGMVAQANDPAGLHARIVRLEAFMVALTPTLAYLGKEFRLEVPAFDAAPAINREGA